ncbi:hypothetical protein HYV50_05595 [Candidatus Pacearchaeota archaeon]|nr:hypothetical protein [Candidatus Pacearchaeota archaeon]
MSEISEAIEVAFNLGEREQTKRTMHHSPSRPYIEGVRLLSESSANAKGLVAREEIISNRGGVFFTPDATKEKNDLISRGYCPFFTLAGDKNHLYTINSKTGHMVKTDGRRFEEVTDYKTGKLNCSI